MTHSIHTPKPPSVRLALRQQKPLLHLRAFPRGPDPLSPAQAELLERAATWFGGALRPCPSGADRAVGFEVPLPSYGDPAGLCTALRAAGFEVWNDTGIPEKPPARPPGSALEPPGAEDWALLPGASFAEHPWARLSVSLPTPGGPMAVLVRAEGRPRFPPGVRGYLRETFGLGEESCAACFTRDDDSGVYLQQHSQREGGPHERFLLRVELESWEAFGVFLQSLRARHLVEIAKTT